VLDELLKVAGTNMEARRCVETRFFGRPVPSPVKIMEDFVNSVNYSLGDNILLGANSPDNQSDNDFVPIINKQLMKKMGNQFFFAAILDSLYYCVMDLTDTFGTRAKMSPALMAALQTCRLNMGKNWPRDRKVPKHDVSNSPQEVVRYCQKMLKSISWNNGMRYFVSVQYKGSVAYGLFLRLTGNTSEAITYLKWAREFITAANKVFKVTKDGAYQEKGSSFRVSCRIGITCSELKAHNALRGHTFHIGSRTNSVDEEISLALEIIELVKGVDLSNFYPATDVAHPLYCELDTVAHIRKPLAYAHGLIAATLSQLDQLIFFGKVPEKIWRTLCNLVGLVGPGDKRTRNAVIAHHYRCAAESDLPDSRDGAVLWWSYSNHMLQSGNSQHNNDGNNTAFTLGDLREVIRKAEAAHNARDTGLFGPDGTVGSPHAMATKMVAAHFRNEGDTFVLPKLKYEKKKGKTAMVIGGVTLCKDISDMNRVSCEYLAKMNYGRNDAQSDMYDVLEEHGAKVRG